MEIVINEYTVHEITRYLKQYVKSIEAVKPHALTDDLVLECIQLQGQVLGTIAFLDQQMEKQNEPTEIHPITNKH